MIIILLQCCLVQALYVLDNPEIYHKVETIETVFSPPSLSSSAAFKEVDITIFTKLCDNCFVSVTNNQGKNIKPFYKPIILRHIIPLRIYATRDLDSISLPFWTFLYFNAPVEYLSNITNTKLISIRHLFGGSCFSSFYNKQIEGLEYCTKINKKLFVPRSRSWNQEINVGLFPLFVGINLHASSNKLCNRINFISPIVFENNPNERNGPSDSLILITTDILPRLDYIDKLREGIFYCSARSELQVILFAKNVEVEKNLKEMLVLPPVGNIIANYQFNLTLSGFTILKVIDAFLMKRRNISYWHYQAIYTGNPFKGVASNEGICEYRVDYGMLPIECKLYQIWLEIISFNLELKKTKNLNDFVGLLCSSLLSPSDQIGEHALLSVEYPPSKIRFIACGETDTSEFPKNILFQGAPMNVWGLVIFHILSASVLFSISNFRRKSFEKFLRMLLSSVKFYMEQPVLDVKWKNMGFGMKVFASLSMLNLLVFTSTYKNGEIVNLVVPKDFVPYRSLNQLINSYYRITSEVGSISLDQFDSSYNFSSCLENMNFSENHHYIYGNCSDGKVIEVVSLAAEAKASKFDSKLVESGEGVYKYSSLAKETINHIRKILSIGAFFVRNQLRLYQKEVLVKKLLACKNSAVIAFEPQIQEYQRILMSNGVSKISVGQEDFSSLKLTYRFRGWLPNFVYSRIQWIQCSGIFNWSIELANNKKAKVQVGTNLELELDDHPFSGFFDSSSAKMAMKSDKNATAKPLIITLLKAYLAAFLAYFAEVGTKRYF